MRFFILMSALVLLCLQGNAAVIKGKVTDAANGEPAIGAVVALDGTSYAVPVGLDGSYTIGNIPAGSYTVKVSLVSYEAVTKKISLQQDETQELVFALKDAKKQLNEVVVTARNTGAGDAGARQLEKRSDNVMNVLSGRTLQLMPDVTVANVLRRVSGITVDRSGEDGEGRYPVIRGMDKRYNYTLINGIKIPSPDDKNRYVPMDIFPSEMLQRLEVIKALTPDMEGDAIGGVMNLVMKDAPEQLTVNAYAATGYAQMVLDNKFTTYDHSAVNKQSPAEMHGSTYAATYADFTKKNLDFKKITPAPDGQLGFTIGNRFFNKKLGIILTGSWQSINRNSTTTFYEPGTQPNATSEGNQPVFGSLQLRDYSTHQSRTGVHAKLDYRFNENNQVSLYAVYMNLNTYQSRYVVDSSLAGRTVAGTGGVNLTYRSKNTLQDIYNATLQGQHKLTAHLYADWSAVYSIAKQQTPDQAMLTLSQSAYIDTTTKKSAATAPTVTSLEHLWQHNSDKDLAGYLNLHYRFNVGTQKLDIGVGGMFRHKNRDNYYNDYTQFRTATTLPVFTNIYDAPFVLNGSTGSQSADPNIYTATEDISAGYAEVKWIPGSKWEILAGARLENTSQQYEQTAVPVTVAGREGTVSYHDLLPSASVKYKLSKKDAVHFSYFKSICRPGFFEIIPYEIVGEDFSEVGNPALHHTKADNFDLRYELFPGGADQLLVGLFYKRITNPIEYGYIRTAIGGASALMPQNQNTANNAGIELVYTKYFKRFGVSANYTYTYSNVRDSQKLYYSTPAAGGGTTITTKFEQVNRPLQGQAAHVGNLSFIYRNKTGLELQLATVYTGRHIVFLSPYEGLSYWQRGTVVLDLSGEKAIGKHFAIYTKLGNLLNTPDYIELMHSSTYLQGAAAFPYQTRDDRIMVEKKKFGQTYLIGIRYHL